MMVNVVALYLQWQYLTSMKETWILLLDNRIEQFASAKKY